MFIVIAIIIIIMIIFLKKKVKHEKLACSFHPQFIFFSANVPRLPSHAKVHSEFKRERSKKDGDELTERHIIIA